MSKTKTLDLQFHSCTDLCTALAMYTELNSENLNIRVDPESLVIATMDSSHVAHISLDLHTNGFFCELEKDQVIGVPLSSLYAIIKTGKAGDAAQIQLFENDSWIHIAIANGM